MQPFSDSTVKFCGLLLFVLTGCVGDRTCISRVNISRPIPERAIEESYSVVEAPKSALEYHPVVSSDSRSFRSGETTPASESVAAVKNPKVSQPSPTDTLASVNQQILPVSHEPNPFPVQSEDKVLADIKPEPQNLLTIDGKTYRLEPVEQAPSKEIIGVQPAASKQQAAPEFTTTQLEIPLPESVAAEEAPVVTEQNLPNTIPINLPTALAMIGGQHPAVGFAQWRVQEAYAQLDRSRVLWLPSIQPGFSFNKHDGNYQASNGQIVDVNRNSFQYGLGSNAVGAGTTPRPGIVAQFHLADAIFLPDVAEKTAWARGHAASGVMNEQLLNTATAYLELLAAEQNLRILEDAEERTADLAKLTKDFAETGQGLQADADRLETELRLVKSRLHTGFERQGVASARLAETLSLSTGESLVPLDPTIVPIELVMQSADVQTLIATGLTNRPELKEAQALVSVAVEEYKRQKYAPLVPSVLLGFSSTGFGGGLSNTLANTNDRVDFDAVLSWEIRNFGLGERAARRESESLIQQAKFSKIRVLDQIAREVNEAHTQVVHRSERISLTRSAIQSAENSCERNLSRIRDGQGLPIEVLQSIQALEQARLAYLNAILEYNQAQFRLQWALGWPVYAPESNR